MIRLGYSVRKERGISFGLPGERVEGNYKGRMNVTQQENECGNSGEIQIKCENTESTVNLKQTLQRGRKLEDKEQRCTRIKSRLRDTIRIQSRCMVLLCLPTDLIPVLISRAQ